jgi:hypothetical protein
MTFSKNYLLASIGLAAVFVMGVIPADISSQVDSKFYGTATLVLNDANGNEVFTQTVHNRVLDAGEDFLIEAAFEDGTARAEASSIGSICISSGTIVDNDETYLVGAFDTANAITEANCEQDNTVTTTGSTAVIGPLNFEAATNDNNLGAGDTVTGIGICQNVVADNNDYNNCATSGILFAIVNTSDVTLASGESVDVTYTFDLTSAAN